MSSKDSSCPAPRDRVVDLYFMEHRAKLIDIAAFLDRLDRSGEGDDDFRMSAFRQAIEILADDRPERARRVLELFSDPTSEPIAAAGEKGATGAWRGDAGGSA
ncbi:MAG: hypothetical protein ACF8PN_03935 [Phycisphaerales bacterium]